MAHHQKQYPRFGESDPSLARIEFFPEDTSTGHPGQPKSGAPAPSRPGEVRQHYLRQVSEAKS